MFVMTRSRHLTKLFVGSCLALALVIGVGATAHPVAAERVGSGIDSVSAGCRSIQDKADALLSQYKEVATANPNDPQLDDILAKIRSNGQDWRDSGCEGTFGSLTPPPARVVPRPIRSIVVTSGSLQGILSAP